MRLKLLWWTTVAAILSTSSLSARASDEKSVVLSKLQVLLDSSPAAKDKVSMLYIPSGSDVRETSKMAIVALAGASQSGLPVALVGPDGALLLQIAVLATRGCPQGVLNGLTVFYLGRDGDDENVNLLFSKCGAKVKFGTYP